MILYRELSWWYWAITVVLLILGLSGHFDALYWAITLSIVQLIHFYARERSLAAFPVQVRICYAALLLLAYGGPMYWLFWLAAIGTSAQVLFGYCALARCLSLLPQNRREPFSSRLVWRAFFSPPMKGNVMQGLPAIK